MNIAVLRGLHQPLNKEMEVNLSHTHKPPSILLTRLDFRNSVCDVFHIYIFLHSFLSGEGL